MGKERSPARLGQATLRLLRQTTQVLHELEQALLPGLEALRGPILRRLDAQTLTARKVEDSTFAPITSQLLILRDRVQRMGDLLDSQRAWLNTRRASLDRLLTSSELFSPDTLTLATALARSITTRLHKSLRR